MVGDGGGEMKVISFIEDHKVIDRIISHLKLAFHAEQPPPQVVQHGSDGGGGERGLFLKVSEVDFYQSLE